MKRAAKPQPSTDIPPLEDMLAEALTNSPEIRVATAAIRQAEAELERVRYEVAQKVIALHGSLQQQLLAVENARSEQSQKRRLFDQPDPLVPADVVAKTQRALSQEERKLSEMFAQLPFTLGRQMRQNIRTRVYPIPVQDKELLPRIAELLRSILAEREGTVSVEAFAPNNSLVISGTEAQHEKAHQTLLRLRELGALDRDVPSAYRLKNATLMERVSNALHRPCSFAFEETPLEDALAFLSDYTGLNFSLARPQDAKVPVTLRIEEVSLGAAIQSLEDKLFLRFYVREYGILVIDGNSTVDSGVRVVEFWKSIPPPADSSEPGAKPSPAAADPKPKKSGQ